jgi:hypothetical protein
MRSAFDPKTPFNDSTLQEPEVNGWQLPAFDVAPPDMPVPEPS